MKKRTTFSFLMKYVFKKWYLLAAAVFCALLTVAGSLYLPILTGKGIDLVIKEGAVDFEGLKFIIFQALIVIALTIMAQLFLSLANNRLTSGVVYEIRKDVMAKIHRLPVSFIDTNPAGDLVSRMIADVETLSDGF